MYLSPKPVAAVAAEVAQLLTAAGWQEYAPLDTQRADLPDMRQMTFRQGGHDLNVSVSTAPAQGNKTAINYHVLALSHELPVPVDARGVELDDAKGELECTVPRPLAEVAADVSKLFAAAGLKETPGEKPTDERIALRFEASNGDVVMATLKNDEGKQTAIRMFTVPAAVVQKLREHEGN
jgi:hypothetical protein